MNIFIDTNIYLNFYNLSNEDLAELSKIQVLQQKEEISIYLPEQVENEFYRNRENVIKNALQQFREDSFKDKVPNMARSYSEFNALEKAKKEYADSKNALMEKMELDINNESLLADNLIKGIFKLAIKIKTNDVIYSNANKRHLLGNPPGKKDSLGDAINWESLLHQIGRSFIPPSSNDLFVISSDGDYQSEMDEKRAKQYLIKEWAERKSGNLEIFKRISLFTKKYFPSINLAKESEKQLSVDNFVSSGSYRTTHNTVAELEKYSDFSGRQVEQILKACILNVQIREVMFDDDVAKFLVNLMEKNQTKISSSLGHDVALMLPFNSDNDFLNQRIKELIKYFDLPF